MHPQVKTFHDARSGTATHVVFQAPGTPCAVIDPVFDLDPRSGHTSDAPVEKVAGFLSDQDLTIAWILETHVHHDHLSGAASLKDRVGGQIGIGAGISEVEEAIRRVYDLDPPSGSTAAFDRLLRDGDVLDLGGLNIEVLATPGHTLDHLSYRIGDAVFVGDTIFMPGSGTARCDFHRGDARQLYGSLQRLLALPPETRLFMCHDYGAGGSRPPAWESRVGEQFAGNIHVHAGVSETEYVAVRTERDRRLNAPALLLPSLQVNICAGRLPRPQSNGTVYLRMPLDIPGSAL